MGFFSSFIKVAQGKPVYDKDQQPKSAAPGDPYRNEQGNKIYPELIVERDDCRLNGNNMQVYAHIKNISEFPLTLDRLRFLGTDKKMPSDLSIGESMQYLVYDGPRPKVTNEGNFEITYCNQAHDYFSAMYYAEFKPEADGTFSVKQFRRQREVKDI